MVERILVELPISPWTERARWALDHHKLTWQRVVHEPFIGEGKLKKLTQTTSGPATTPCLIEGDQRFTSSTAIARHADATGSGSKLIPAGQESAVERWVENAEHGSRAGRMVITRRLLDQPAALDEQLPAFLPGFVRPLLRPVTRYGTRWFAKKYALDIDDKDALAAAEAVACRHIDRVREGLAGRPYLLESFSWADVVSCLLLQAVKPVQHPKYPLRPATRKQWEAPHLVDKYADLLRWRDDLYAQHR